MLETNPQLELASSYVEETNTNIFLTGRAGTGKTTFLRNLRENTFKRNIVVAPTGVAAINANGMTIHSFFQVSFGPFLPNTSFNNILDNGNSRRFSKQKINIIRSLDLLIIDEISMVRADLLDAVDAVLKRFRKGGRYLPFGGVQLLLIGDLQQLPPVCKDDEWNLLKDVYETPYFFSSKALMASNFFTINLQKVFRQRDERFISILNDIRNNTIKQDTIEELNKRYIPNFLPKDDEGYITLCTHNYQAKNINDEKLKSIKNPSFFFKATVKDEFYESSYPNDFELELKKDAQVMFVKNDYSSDATKRRYYNGKIGKIVDIDKDKIIVRCIGEENDIEVSRYVWNNYKYEINNNTKAIEEKVIGTFEQYPLKLAWAITIHKSQGLTFDKVVIDSNKAFASGQVYVALSRCRTLEGIVLSSRFESSSIKKDNTITNFDNNQENNKPSEQTLENDRQKYYADNVFDLISFSELKWILDTLEDLNNQEFSKLYGQSSAEITNLINRFTKEILEISYKFHNQLNTIFDRNEQDLLIERLKKSGEYFKDKLSIIGEIEKIVSKLEFDNEEINKKKEDIFTKILQESIIKNRLLDTAIDGFELKKYLKVKNELLSTDEKSLLKRLVDKEKENKKKTSLSPKEINDNELFETLRAWRLAKSKELNLSAFYILNQKSLLEIVRIIPKNENELLEISGIGKKKVEQFGNEILEIIAEHNLLEVNY
ncbi:MAG: putative helicase [Bacteroidetes bacterium]|nr:putative helicase [Bacteroidota bacterium]